MRNGRTGDSPRLFWCDSDGKGRNVFCIFQRTVLVSAPVRDASLEIFADSLYRLIVNDEIVGRGPVRFHPDYPEHDTYDLVAALRPGENVIRVEVNSRGTDCFQAMPGRGGLALSGHIDGLPIGLPEGWKVCHSHAWDKDSENFSFAQGPIEVCDTLELRSGRGEFHDPVAVEPPVPWGRTRERSIPRATREIIRPVRLAKACGVQEGFFRTGFRAPPAGEGRQPFFTHICSPQDRDVEARVFWGPLAMHGRWLTHSPCVRRGNCETVIFPLKRGWNFLFGVPEILKPAWPWMMELPEGCGLEVCGLPGTGDGALFYTAPVDFGSFLGSVPPGSAEELPGFPESWTGVHHGFNSLSPARELAWDMPGDDILPAGSEWAVPVQLPGGRTSTVVLDFGGEFLGHAFVEVSAPAHTVLDVGFEERLKESGIPDYYRCNPFINSADRFVLRGGNQRIECFHERGGRYLQLTFRNTAGPVGILDAGIRSSCGDYPSTGRFRCGDEDLDWAWAAGERTLRTSMADGWIDPWRERGLYIGDALVQGHATRKITSDWRLDPWCLRLWARSQFSDGQLPDVVPSTPHRPLCDYTLIWIMALRNYWAASGDVALVEELWPCLLRIFESPVWSPARNGMWEVTPRVKLFIDWGAVSEERLGVNASLNAFRFHALRCSQEMAAALGRKNEVERFERESESVRAGFHETFWSADLSRFTASEIGGRVFTGPGRHANALALAFGLCTGEQIPAVADYVAGGLRVSGGLQEGRCELYFLYYALEGLYRARRAAAAEEAMREYHGLMRRAGAWTLWETLKEGMQGLDSMCHGWSSGALPYLSERVLGVRPVKAGIPSRMLIAPEAETLDHAEGVVPHPAGPISVRWKVQGRGLKIAVTKPEEVEIVILPQGRLGDLAISADVRKNEERQEGGTGFTAVVR